MAHQRALIVDDSTTAQYRLKKMLRTYNLETDAVDSGEAALRYLASNMPDVVFMDHLMPGMDGFRALQIIKSHPETAMIPVIMYTSKSGDVYTGQARALGALDVMNKDTINAADLSKVLEAIGIHPKVESPADTGPELESAEFIAAANQPSSAEHLVFERNSSTAASDQARNLELRLSHMEHTLEDNRRFITSRVVRELQGLRQNMKQEFSDILQKQALPPAASAAAEPLAAAPQAASGSNWLGKLLLAAIALGALFFLVQIATDIKDTQEQQLMLSKQIGSMTTRLRAEPDEPSPAMANIKKQDNLLAQKYADDAYLADISWAFNQSGSLAFNQSTIEPKAVIRIYELLNRLISNGFKGSAWVDVYVGNFCLSINSFGQAYLPGADSTLNDCMLSSEIYGMEQVMADYSRELNSAINNLSRGQVKVVNISVKSQVGDAPYPERLPTQSAPEWNAIAQQNNRVELRLESSAGY
jgi:CheY-like chemotaxis protein